VRKIFLSSTARDFGECCKELARVLNALEGWHCVWMEDFSASDATSVEYCQKRVQQCDVYVGVIGTLYGSSPPYSDISFTQHEYEAAVTKGMPRLIFLTREDFRIPANLRDTDMNREAQQKFRERVCQERMVKFFDDPKDLRAHVIASLFHLAEETGETARPPSRGSSGEPNLGPDVYRLCDRGPQEDEFTSFFRQKTKDLAGAPHIYILRGEERESLDSLIDRFRSITIGNLIPQLNLPRVPVICRLVRWPDPASSRPEEALVAQLFARIAENEPYQALDAAALVKLALLRAGGILALKHEIRAKRWTPMVVRLIDWYCGFWDEVAALHPKPRILVFLSILYPNGTKEQSWKSRLPFPLVFGPVDRDLLDLQNRRQRETERNPEMCPIAQLPEVRCVRDDHLREWFSTNGICDQNERDIHCQRLFAIRDCIHMAEVEPELKKIVAAYRNQRT
jgi:Domain of unknown function (DUF4062)/inactive STAND